MKYTTAMLLIVLTLGSPFVTLAQQAQQDIALQAIEDAKRDVDANINKPMWFVMGCFIGTGLMMSYMTTPTVPTAKLIGKDPIYVAHYTDTYKIELKKAQTQAALGGCITLGLVWVAIGVMSGLARATQ